MTQTRRRCWLGMFIRVHNTTWQAFLDRAWKENGLRKLKKILDLASSQDKITNTKLTIVTDNFALYDLPVMANFINKLLNVNDIFFARRQTKFHACQSSCKLRGSHDPCFIIRHINLSNGQRDTVQRVGSRGFLNIRVQLQVLLRATRHSGQDEHGLV